MEKIATRYIMVVGLQKGADRADAGPRERDLEALQRATLRGLIEVCRFVRRRGRLRAVPLECVSRINSAISYPRM
jgi:hypothetical protein